jgi:YHS domain-containing protein
MRKLLCTVVVGLAASLSVGCQENKPHGRGHGHGHGHAAGDKMGPECPVCAKHGHHMNVNVSADTPRATHNGQTYYFCEASCRDAFMKNPSEFATRN